MTTSAPKRAPVTTVTLIALTVILLCGVGVVAAFTRSSPDASKIEPISQSDMAITMCEKFVKERLKSPTTAKFSDEAAAAGSHADEYAVVGQVDAQNGFGAMIRNQFRCELTISGDTWTARAVTLR